MFRKSCFPSGSEGKESTCKVASVYLIHCLSFIVGKLNWKIALIKEKQFVTILTDTTNTGRPLKKQTNNLVANMHLETLLHTLVFGNPSPL